MKSLNATHYELIPPYPSKKDRKHYVVHAIIETPKWSPFKFALDARHGIIALKDVMPSGFDWPFDYGFIPGTLGDDGDPLDVLMMMDTPTFSGCMIKARLLGAIRLRKNGAENDRFITAPQPMAGVTLDPDRFETLRDIGERRAELDHFLCGYSEEQGNHIELVGSVEREEAEQLIDRGRKSFTRAQH